MVSNIEYWGMKLRRSWRSALFGLAVVSVAAAVGLNLNRHKIFAVPVLPGLAARLAEVKAVAVDARRERFFALKDEDGNWFLPDMHGFPVDRPRMESLLNGMAGLQVQNVKTSDPELFSQYYVDDGDYAVTMMDESGKPVAGLIVGSKIGSVTPGAKSYNLYVRRPGTQDVIMTKADFAFPASANDWLDRALVEFAPEEIDRIDTGKLAFERDRNQNVWIITASDGTKRISDSANNIVESASAVLSNLKFTGFAKDAQEPPKSTLTVSTNGGLHVQFEFVGKNLVRIKALRKEEAGQKSVLAAAQAAAQIDGRHSGWLYELPEEVVILIDTLKAL